MVNKRKIVNFYLTLKGFFIFKKFNLDTLLLFIGSPRTGSTMLGQILNYHPQCLVSNEESLVPRLIIKKENIFRLISDVRKNALDSYYVGLERTRKYKGNLDKFQKKWKSFADFAKDPIFKKENLKIIGDKKAGGTAKCALAYREDFINLIEKNKFIKLLQIVREPVEASLSHMNSHEINSFEEACDEIVKLTNIGQLISKKIPNRFYTLYYEDLLDNPRAVITNLLGFLNLNQHDEWLTKVSTRINKNKVLINNSEKYK